MLSSLNRYFVSLSDMYLDKKTLLQGTEPGIILLMSRLRLFV